MSDHSVLDHSGSNNPWRDWKTDPPAKDGSELLLLLSRPVFGIRLHTIRYINGVNIVAGYIFPDDVPKVLKWKYAEEFYPD